jgi:hypothetical protein
MLTDVLDRARAKCRSRGREYLDGDSEAARWHPRLQISLRRHRLERQLNKAHRRGWEGQSANYQVSKYLMPARAVTHSVVHPRIVP